MTRRALWVGLYAVAMAAVESAVVVYLRALHPITDAPTAALLAVLPDRLIAVEVGREVATIVMLAAVAALAAHDRWGRFLYFSLAFGVWDIFYYFWLWVFIGWPPSLLTWDVLFLIPVPWLGPVLAPVVISVCLVAGALGLLALQGRGVALRFPRVAWGLVALGAALVLLSFTLDYRFVLDRHEPDAFRWGLFGAGVGLGVVGFGLGVRTVTAGVGSANPGAWPRG
jgi:hypothetical protein